MKANKARLLLSMLWVLMACAPPICNRDHSAQTALQPLLPGRYRLQLTANAGSKNGKSASGNLWLKQTSAEDRSPRTGQGPPKNEDRAKYPLYGWLDVDLAAVGAPCYGEQRGESRDPIFPGVLVVNNYKEKERVLAELLLLVDTGSNERTGDFWLDGDCIALTVHESSGNKFSGTWSEWGVVVDGSGCFVATKTE